MGAHRLALLVTFGSLALVSSRASAQDATPSTGRAALTITNTTLLGFRGNNFDRNIHDDDFASITERFDIAAQWTHWRVYARIDGFSPWNHDTSCADAQPEVCYLQSNWRPGSYSPDSPADYANITNLLPERLSVRYHRGDVTVEAGDHYQVFGRGLTLAFRKVDPIGLDTTLRGGRFEYEHDRITVRAFGGLANPQNLDPKTLSIFQDPQDLLVGASFGARAGAFSDLELSGHAVHADFERDANAQTQDRVDVAGFRFECPSLLDGSLSLYGEADVLSRVHRTSVQSDGSQRGPTERSWGRAIYASAQLVTGRWTLLAEWKDYTDYLVAPTMGPATPRDVARIYSTAPSLERDDQRLFTNANTRGARLRVDYAFESVPWILTLNSVLYGWSDHAENGALVDPWDSTYGYITSHTYFTVRRRSRPVVQQGPAQGGAGAAQGGGQVARGDYNLLASVGYRREFHAGTAGDFEAGDIKHESVQGEIDVAFPVGTNDSLELRLDHRFERNFTFDRITGFDLEALAQGIRGGFAVTWSHGLPLTVSAMLRWDNVSFPRPITRAQIFDAPLGVGPDPNNPRVDPLYPTLYPSAEVRWNFTINSFLRVFGGMTPGGRVCSGGVCRDVPLFQGAIGELVLRI